jgi:tRNA threonylcarbamoyladenosine biosynthesis protein TsaB
VPLYTLAIETSNPASGPTSVALALHNSPAAIATEQLRQPGRNHDDLAAAIARLFHFAGTAPTDLASIAISIGPGGYTSLRIAVATAKMLAEATGASTIPIPSALAAAWPLALSEAPILVLLASKNDSAHATLLPSGDRARWPADYKTIGIITAPDVAALAPRALIADRFLPAPFRDEAARLNIPILEPAFTAEAALALAPHFPEVDPLALTPLYPREPEAVTLWRARKA